MSFDPDEIAKKAITEQVDKFCKSDEFRRGFEAEYKRRIETLVFESESKARKFAAAIAVFIAAVFASVLLFTYADIANKHSDLYEKYSKSNELVNVANKSMIDIGEKYKVKAEGLSRVLDSLQSHARALEGTVKNMEQAVKASKTTKSK
ncbi:MAG: hypothetical protein HY961_13780 [Ignavibacteriae bacterium]|nr:hypothetical protein [Ignavibacteriota bacterium]